MEDIVSNWYKWKGNSQVSHKTPTMTDVAKAAGVSQSTVSLVLNGKAEQSIPEATQLKVLQACEMLGYQMNYLARALNRSESGMIGMLADELLTANFAGAIVSGAQDMSREKGKILMLSTVDQQDDKIAQRAIDYLKGFRVESIVYAAKYHHQITFPDSLKNVPTVLVNCYESSNTIPCILPDDYWGGYQATKYLLDHGHRNIYYISSNLIDELTGEHIPATPARVAGFMSAMQDYGLNPKEEECVSYVPIEWEGVVQEATRLLQSPNRPTAILCYNDRMALSVYSVASVMNIRIPEDLSVIGYDNQVEITEFLYPRLTTVELPHYEMGARGIKYLETQKYPFEYEQYFIRPKLVIRQSVASV